MHTFKLAGKVFTTEPDLRAMIEAARCRDQGKAPGSTSDPALTARRRGSSETEAHEVSTGCGEGELERAEQALERYIAGKYSASAKSRQSAPRHRRRRRDD